MTKGDIRGSLAGGELAVGEEGEEGEEGEGAEENDEHGSGERAEQNSITASDGHPFSALDRIKLMTMMIKASMSKGGCGLDPERLIRNGSLLAFFPLPEPEKIKKLEAQW